MLATTAVRLGAQQAPVAVGLLLRGPRPARGAALLRQAPPRSCTRRGVSAAAAPTTPFGPEYTLLEYEYTHHDAELLAKREPYLEEHLRLCREMADEGKLLLWGAVGTPVTGGMLIWRSGDAAEVERFVKRDPFVANGLVRHWVMRPFHVHVVDEHRGY